MALALRQSAACTARPALASSRRLAVSVRASAEEQPQQASPATTTAAPEQIEAVAVPLVQPVPVAAAAAPAPPSLFEAMSFSTTVGPETINGRLAMLGLFAAVGAELATGQSAVAQFEGATPVVLATWATVAIASLIPLLRGADPTQSFGPLTQPAELANGRAAMLGVVGLLVCEFAKGSALF